VFVVGVPWLTVAKNLILPHVSLAGGYLTVVVAVFGTTISPYLFFWQAAEEVEDEKQDPSAEPLLKAPEQAPAQMARMQIDTFVFATQGELSANARETATTRSLSKPPSAPARRKECAQRNSVRAHGC
jgi:Mn2+/Fe2+ NRAMP family transporter